MKKLLLLALLLFSGAIHSQSDFYPALTSVGSISGNGRAPQGAAKYNRSVWIITAAEMTASGFTTNSIINAIGFNYSTDTISSDRSLRNYNYFFIVFNLW